MSRTRILHLVFAFVGFATLLALGLAKLAIVDQDQWLERSLRNRWAFRDVPTRRGSIVDAQGLQLAFDVPGFDLELRYATFRRAHPLAACVHGGNLWHAARGEGEPYDYLDLERSRGALGDLLSIPLSSLRSSANQDAAAALDPPVDDVARDLRFYLGSLVAALSGAPRSRLAAALATEVRAGQGTVLDGLVRIARAERVPALGDGATLGARLGAQLDARIAELAALDARLQFASTSARDVDLFAFLEERRRHELAARRLELLPADEAEALRDPGFWADLLDREIDWTRWDDWRGWLGLESARRASLAATFLTERAKRREARDAAWLDPTVSPPPLFASLPDGVTAPRFEDEERPRRVRARLPHDLASWLSMIRENHPGFALRASVLRAHGRLPGRDGLSSLAPIVGRVSEYYLEGRTPEQDAARVLASEADFARHAADSLAGTELSDRIEDGLRARAEAALRAHYGRLGRIGRSGVEAAFGDVLSGRPGLRFVERDKQARELRMFESLDVAPGDAVQLTLDARLQVLAEDALGELQPDREKALVVLDAQTGDVLAIVSRTWRRDASESSFGPGAWSPSYNPYVGSVAKPLIALEFLRALRADPALGGPSTFPACGGRGEPYDRARRLRCGEVHGDGSRDSVHAIAESCNVYFFRVADELGAEGVRAAYAAFGWDAGAEPSPTLQRTVSGLPQRSWTEPRLRPQSFQVPMQAIGYGVEVWPLFVARAYAAIATGRLCEVRFVRDAHAGPGRDLPYHQGDLRTVRDGLRGCVDGGTADHIRGTAVALLADFGLVLAGKTGTAEVTESGELNNAWFAGYLGEGDAARLAFAAVEYRTDDHGGTSAAPMVARFLEAVRADAELRERWLTPGGGRGR